MTERDPVWTPRTIAAQALGVVEPVTKAVVPPVHMATTFIRDPDNQYRSGFSYGRPDNATVRQTENVLAALEGADDALLFGSGMAAATAVVLALDPPAHIVAPKVMYWALRNWLLTGAQRLGYWVSIVDMTDLQAVREASRPGETMVRRGNINPLRCEGTMHLHRPRDESCQDLQNDGVDSRVKLVARFDTGASSMSLTRVRR